MTSEGIFSKANCSQHFPYTLFVASARDFCEFWFESSPDRNCPFRGTASLFPSGSPAVLTQMTAEDTGRGPGPALAAHRCSWGWEAAFKQPQTPRGSPRDTQLMSLSFRACEHHRNAYKLFLVFSDKTAPCKNGRKGRFGAVDGGKNSKSDVCRKFTHFHSAL